MAGRPRRVLGDEAAERPARASGENGPRAQRRLGRRAAAQAAARRCLPQPDLYAILAGVLVMEQGLASPASRGRGLAVIADGLRARPMSS